MKALKMPIRYRSSTYQEKFVQVCFFYLQYLDVLGSESLFDADVVFFFFFCIVNLYMCARVCYDNVLCGTLFHNLL